MFNFNPWSIGLGAAGLGLSWLLSRGNSTRTANGSALQNPFTPNVWVSTPPPPPVDGLGGEKDRLTPFFTGASNRANPWGAFPYLMGKMKMYPSVIANAYTYLQGSDQYITSVLCTGYGPVTLTKLKIGDVDTYTGFTHEYLAGFSDNEPVTYYTKDVEPKNVAKQLLANQEIIELVPQECDRISIDIQFDQGHYNNHEYINLQTGDIKYVKEDLTTHFSISYRLQGVAGWTVWNGFYGITGNTEKTNRQNITFNVALGVYEVRLIRLTADSTSSNIINATSWQVLTGIRNVSPFNFFNTEKGNQVRIAKLSYRAKSTQKNNGVLSEINGLCSRSVPAWNGSAYVMTETDNPAWYYVDVLTGQAFGESIDKSEIDIDAVYAWAQYCTAKGWKINHIIDSQMEISEALNMICRAGRANWYIKDGKYSVVYDDVRATQVQTFTEHNSRGYVGTKNFPIIPNCLSVRFLNEKNDYKPDMRMVYWDGFGPTSTNLITEQIDMPGVTDPALIYKHARYELAVMRLRPESAQVTTNLQHLVCNIGDKVRLAHSAGRLALGSGAIESVITNGGGDVTGLVLSNAVVMVLGESYEIEVRLKDGTFTTQTVTAAEGEFDTITLTTPILNAVVLKPQRDDSFVFGRAGELGMLCLVSGIEHQANFEATVSMVPYSPEVFAADSGTVPAYDTNVSIPHESNWILPQPTYWTIRSDESVLLRKSDGSLESRIVVALAPPLDVRVTHFQTEFKLTTDENWTPAGSTVVEKGQIVIDDVEDGLSYTLRIRHYAEPGKASDWLELSPHTVIGKTSKPPNVISVTMVANTKILRWNAEGVPPDFAGYRVFYHIGNSRNKETATVLTNLLVDRQVNLAALPRTLVTVGVVMVDVVGNESEIPAWAVVDLGDIAKQNIIVQDPLHPTFPGEITNGTVSGGILYASDNGATQWNPTGTTLQWSPNPADDQWTATYLDMTYKFAYIAPAWLAFYDYNIMMRFGEELKVYAPQGYKVEIRVPGAAALYWVPDGDAEPMWSADGNTLVWDFSDPLVPWTGIREGRIEEIEVAITLFGGKNQPYIEECSIGIDVPDVTEYVDDFEILPGGSRLPLTKTYTTKIVNCIPSLNYSAVYPTAERWIVQDKDSSLGPLVEIFDAAGVSVGGIVDAVIKGY